MPNELAHDMGIAVVGMAGRFPGAKDLGAFWRNLAAGTDVLTHFTDDELRDHIPADLLRNNAFVKAGYVLDDVDAFDAAFFGYTPNEAKNIDPQQRLFLECAWEAFEDAGYVPGEHPSVGVFASVTPSGYLPFEPSRFPGSPGGFFEVLLGNDKDYAAARVAYKLNLKGPAFAVQSACSSSLTGICVACQSLLDFQCDMALAGGASITLPERTGYLASEEGGLSLDGRCHAFDHRASGMNSGNGVAVLLLKRLEDAVAAGDHIYGVIRGFAVNNDGSDKVGFVAPSVSGQKNVIAEALAISGFDPGSVSYVEAHGTGTPLGDPIEIRALTEAYGNSGAPCALGSVKTNIGHLNSAAGAAGLVRVMLSLEHGMLTPLLHFEKANPEIDFAATRFFPNTEYRPWTAAPRRAGVSSFGLGGTNAHVVVEEAPAVRVAENTPPWHLVPLSARSGHALDMQAFRLREFLREHEDADPASLAYTCQTGRKPFPHRRFLLCRNREELLRQLEEGRWEEQREAHSRLAEGDRTIFFLFPGAGSQYAGMGRGLYEEEPLFRQHIDQCADLFIPLLGTDIRTPLHAAAPEQAEAALREPATGMAALFATEYALARLWMHWGIQPDGCAGHSFGQYAAATVCGVLSLEDAARVVVKRGQLMEKVSPGGMSVLFAPEDRVRTLLAGTLSLAAVNTDALCTVAGSTEDLEALEQRLTGERIRFRRLPVTRAGHSCLMDPVLDEFRDFLKNVPLRRPSLPLFCNVTGGRIADQDAVSPDYWADHIRQPVRFSSNLEAMLHDPQAVLLEVGPGKGLTSFARRHAALREGHAVAASLRGAGDPPDEDGRHLRQAYGQLFLAGVNPRWFQGAYAERHPARMSLPAYPFERQRFWRDGAAGTASRGRGGAALMRKLMDKQEDSEKWYFLPAWTRGPLLSPLTARELEALPRDWMVFTDTLGLGDAVAARLEAAGKRAVRIRAGSGFSRQGLSFTVDPSSERDYEALFQTLREERVTPGPIVHAWTVTADADLERGLAFYEASLRTGYRSLIALVRALTAANMEQLPISLGVVSNHLQSVTGEELLSPEKALVLGPCRVIPSEFLHMQSMSIDLETPPSGGALPDVVDSILRDVAAIPHPDPSEPLTEPFRATVAYRGRHRWERFFDRVRLPLPDPARVPLRDRGVYMITGGFGGVASELSLHLARTRRARLVLTGRTALPPREAWDAWLRDHAEDDAASRRIRHIRRLEEEGAQVLPVAADMADANAMRRGWDEALRTFGRIDGVFHAASTASSSMIQAQTEEKAFAVISPKVHGTLLLEELAGDSLDFLMLFSSISSHVGALGHTDYTAACLFMDTFTQMKNRRKSKTRTVAVNWGYWDGVGIGVRLLPKLMELLGDGVPVRGILPAEGMHCVERALAAPVEQLIVSTSDYGALVAAFMTSTKNALTEYESFHVRETRAARPHLATPYAAPSNDVERVVRFVWQDLFGMEGIGVNDTFIELGGDSLHALPMISKLEEIFRIKVPIRSLLEENTVAKLSSYLMANESKEGQTRLIARMFLKVRDMDPEEVKKMLADTQKDRS